jgi:hypothetical protein
MHRTAESPALKNWCKEENAKIILNAVSIYLKILNKNIAFINKP